MKDYFIGCFLGIFYIIVGSCLFGQEKCLSVATILIGAMLIFIVPYKNGKSLYLNFIEKMHKK